MIKHLIALVLPLLISFQLSAAELKAELTLIGSPEVLKEGDLIEGVLKVWPLENMNLEQFKQLENMTLGSSLLVTEIESTGVSANNAEVAEIKLLFAVKPSPEAVASLSIEGQQVVIQIPPIKVEMANLDQTDYVVLDQGLISSKLLTVIILMTLVVLIIGAIWKRKTLGGFIQKFKADPVAAAIKKYNELFLYAKTRQDYEKIYALRKDWLSLNKVQAHAFSEFFKKMEQHQYKKDWSDQELDEVKSSFDIIRGSFK